MRVSLLNFTISWHKFVKERERQSCNSHAIEIPLIKFDKNKKKNQKFQSSTFFSFISFHATLFRRAAMMIDEVIPVWESSHNKVSLVAPSFRFYWYKEHKNEQKKLHTIILSFSLSRSRLAKMTCSGALFIYVCAVLCIKEKKCSLVHSRWGSTYGMLREF